MMDVTQVLIASISAIGLCGAAWLGKKAVDARKPPAIELIETMQAERRELKQECDDLKLQASVMSERMRRIERENLHIKTGVQYLTMIGERAPFAMWCKNADGIRVWQNQAYEELTGFSADFCLGKDDYEITQNPDVAADWISKDAKVMRTGQPILEVEKCCHVDSPEEVFPVLSAKYPNNVGHMNFGTVGAAMRVSEIKEAFKEGGVL